MRSPRLCRFAAFAGVAALCSAASFDDRVAVLFRRPLGERLALSPDGQRLAYTAPRGDALALVVMNLDPPGPKRIVKIGSEHDAAATTAPEPASAAAPQTLRFLRWATPNRLVFALEERVVPLPPIAGPDGRSIPNPDGPVILAPILAVDPEDGRCATLVDARQFQETPAEARHSLADLLRTTQELQSTRREAVRWRMPHLDILGFLPRQPEQLILQTRGAYSMPMQHLVDIRTGSVREFGDEWPVPPAAPQIFDPYRLKIVGTHQDAARPATAWRDEELGRVQRELERKFPRRAVEILDWSETRARVLCRVTGGSDAGRIFVYQRPEDIVLEVFRRAPWLSAEKLHPTRFMELSAADGASLTGYVTWPRQPRVSPPPLLLAFADGFPGCAHPAFDPEAQVFADLGYAVMRLNHRYVAGVKPAERDALRIHLDRTSVDDAITALEALAKRHPERPFDRRRVVAFGRGFGGYLALRALQLQPAVFRCAVAIDAPLDPGAWLSSTEIAPANARVTTPATPATLSVLEHVEKLTQPVLLLHQPTRDPAIDRATIELRERLRSLGRAIDCAELDAGFAAGRAESRVTGYRKIEEFLNLRLNRFAAQIGATQEVP